MGMSPHLAFSSYLCPPPPHSLQQRFKRTLRPVDWNAFTRYAPLIRVLAFREGRDVLPSSVVALDMQRPARYRLAPLLPNLTTLKWTVSMSNTLTLCIPLVSPSLKSLFIHVVGAQAPAAERNDATGGLLCTLVDIAPDITHVSLNIDKLWTVGDVVNPLISLNHLRVLTLDVGSIGPFLLRGLCQHKSLSRLEIDLCGIDESFLGHLSDHRPRPDEFPALKDLSITADMHIVNTTFSLLLRAPLTSITISTFTLVHPNALSCCLSLLSHTSPNLCEIRIVTSFPLGNIKSFECSTRLEETRLDFASLTPLLALKRLQVVSFHLFYPVELEDVEAAMLIGALPSLREFTMNPAPEWAPGGWKPSITARLLPWLATNATGLKSLGLAMDYGALLDENKPELGANSGGLVPPAVPAAVATKERGDGARGEGTGEPRVSPPTPPLTPEGTVVLVERSPHQDRLTEGRVPELEILSLGASIVPAGMEDGVAERLVTLFPRLQTLRPLGELLAGNGGGMGGESGLEMKERWDRVEDGIRTRRGLGGGAGGAGAGGGGWFGRRLRRGGLGTDTKRTPLVFEIADADVEPIGVCGEENWRQRQEADEYEWGLALRPMN